MFPILGHKKQCFNETQEQILMEMFQANEYLTKRKKHELAMLLNTEEERIAIWYAKMRLKNVNVPEGMLSHGE